MFPTTTASSTPFVFPSLAAPANINFGSTTTTASTQPLQFSFNPPSNVAAQPPTTQFSFVPSTISAGSTGTAPASTPFSLFPSSNQQASTGNTAPQSFFSSSTSTTATATSSAPLSLFPTSTASSVTSTAPISFFQQPASTTASAPNFGTGTGSTAPLSFFPSATAATTTVTVSSTVPIASSTGASIGPLTTSTITPVPQFNLSTLPTTTTTAAASTASVIQPLTTTAAAVTTAPTTTSAASALSSLAAPAAASTGITNVKKLTFGQLRDQTNIWLNELNLLENDFHQQSETINSWDSLLINNAVKITDISSTLEKLKLDHQRINNQLDFIISEQNEFEQLLEPLEKMKQESDGSDVGTSEREMTYNMMETVFNDLQGIGSDLQSFIKQLNEMKVNKESHDPLASISKILNSHMNALQYLEHEIEGLKAS